MPRTALVIQLQSVLHLLPHFFTEAAVEEKMTMFSTHVLQKTHSFELNKLTTSHKSISSPEFVMANHPRNKTASRNKILMPNRGMPIYNRLVFPHVINFETVRNQPHNNILICTELYTCIKSGETGLGNLQPVEHSKSD